VFSNYPKRFLPALFAPYSLTFFEIEATIQKMLPRLAQKSLTTEINPCSLKTHSGDLLTLFQIFGYN
jgi:hypothetical protein